MERIQLIAPCHFGMEAVLKREIYDLGYEITKVEDGRVTFEGDLEAICRGNVFLRTAERLMVQDVFMQQPLMSCMRALRLFLGNSGFQRMANSG